MTFIKKLMGLVMSKDKEKAENIEKNKDKEALTPEEEKKENPADQEKDEIIKQLGLKITELEGELSLLKDQYIRRQADFENFRKRIYREKEDSIKYANSSLLLDLVTVIDDFERAIKSAEEKPDFEAFLSGITIIEKQLVGVLERNWGLKRMESQGEEFDPEKHEALMAVETPEQDKQIVLEDFQKGYMLHDRVIRHAKVKVSVPAAKKEEQEPAEIQQSNLETEEEKQ